MEKKLEQRLKDTWLSWNEKPWHCPKCDLLLNMKMFTGCGGGTHPYKPTFGHVPYHDWIDAKRPVTFKEFCNISYKWYKPKK